ncbi:VWA domain-containing protein [Rhizomonospora bruguierae]|uniref:VWA domain-containing protein n=1 Tax=Rhizomonospora bruguierae TaxID=1581705 RepID=UPI001BCACBA0|nr:VWA domain-containing protein [Micromonospora sp. NBRC 107566]
MTGQPQFVADVDQNEYLPAGRRTVDAIVTVTASGGELRASAPALTAAEVIMIDTSGSMTMPQTKIHEAKKATAVAIDTLRDGVAFAVIAGSANARMVYPADTRMVPADPRTRAEAKEAVARLRAEGGTAIGRWLHLANYLFAYQPAEVKHAILLTDGQNQHETPQELQAVLDQCEGKFTCDSRGVGADWVADELRKVASTLLGTADGLEDPAELPAAFRAMTEGAMGKSVADVKLRVWTPAGATLRFVKQVFPQVEDLTGRGVDVSARIGDYPTGAWGAESRDYHISVEVEPQAVGEELLAARVSVVGVDGPTIQVLTERLVLARWTDDTELSTRINPQVAHYTGQAELAAAIQEGLKARDAGDAETATAKLGRAVQLANESGHTDTAKLLARVVDVVDAPTGTVRLKKQVAGVDAELTNVRSVKTIRVKKKQD